MCDAPSSNSIHGKIIDLSEAVGTVLAHDMTEIRPGEFKGAAFRKGHVVTSDDLDHLARMGKRHLYVLDIPDGMMHEDEAALILAESLAGPNVSFSKAPCEGKLNLIAECDGLLKVNGNALIEFNMVEGVMCASRHSDTLVTKGDVVAGTRAIPLVIEQDVVTRAADVAASVGYIFEIKPLSQLKTALVITGNEVYNKLIEDKFAEVMRPKLAAYDCPVIGETFAPDDADHIARSITEQLENGAELIILTGGMSVDPDDVTRRGVALAGAEDIIYGTAVLPGAMLMVARIGDVPVIGTPACALYHPRTMFDLVLPKILAGERVSRRDLAAMGHGGMCLNCPTCKYPVCPFGKGSNA